MPKRKASGQSDFDQKKVKIEANHVQDSPQTESILLKTQSLINDLRNDKSVKNVVNKIEANVKDAFKKANSNELSCLFKAILTALIEKSFNSDSYEFERLLLCLSQFKVESLNHDELVSCLTLVTEHIKKTSKPVEDKIEPIISNICKYLNTTMNASKVTEMFNTIINEFKSNHLLLLQALCVLNGARILEHNTLVVQLIKQLLSVNKVKLPSHLFERLFFNLLESCSIYALESQYAFVYEQILLIVLEKRKKIDEKTITTKLESSTIQMIVSHLISTRNTSTSHEYLIAFKSVLNKTLVENEILDKFILCLYFSTFNILSSKTLCEQYNDFFAEFVKNLLDISDEIKKSAWLQNCTYKNYTSFQLSNTFNNRLMCRVITPETFTNGIFHLSKCLLNKFMKSNENESLSNFLSQIIEELFSINLPNKHVLINEYLHLCFKTAHRSFYIDLFNKLLNKESIRKLFTEQLNEIEKAKVQITIVSNLIASSPTESILFIETTNDAVNLLNALQPIIFDLKIEHVKELVDYFETNLKNASKVKVSSYCLISLIKSLNTKVNIRSTKDENKLEQHFQFSIRILEQFKDILRKSPDPELRSQIYQSFYYLIKHNSKLIQPISTLLLKQFKKFTILPKFEKSKQVYLDLGKCFVIGEQIQLVEPIDVLFHSVCVCVDRMNKQQQNQASSQKNIIELKSLIDSILITYTENVKTNQIDSLYNKQISSVLNHNQSIGLLKMVHQIKLGLIDTLIEYSTVNHMFTEIPKLIECYENTFNLNSLDLENLVLGKLTPPSSSSSSVKRKLFMIENSITTKKLKTNDENKENKLNSNNKPAQRPRTIKREPLTEITNEQNVTKSTVLETSTLAQDKPKTNISFANIQISSYEPRISLDCILKLISLTQISSTNQFLIDIKLTKNEQIRSRLISLITNTSFNEYIVKVIESKLKSMIDTKLNKPVYNIHSNEQKELFEMLSTIWNNFFQRIIVQTNTSKSDKFSFKPSLPSQFNQNFLVKFHRCLNICVDIWKIVNKNFSSNLINLISSKTKPIFSNEHQELVWKFLIDCTNKIELLIKSTEANSFIISKCCSILLRMINDIIDRIDLSLDKTSNLYAWLCKIAKKPIAGEIDTTQAILDLFIKISSRKFSSSVILKHLLLEYHNYVSINNPQSDIQNQIEYGVEFKLLNERNSSEYYSRVLYELSQSLDQIKWSIELNNYFMHSKLVNLTINNLESVIIGVDFLIQSTSDWNSVNLALTTLDKFYQFMIFFINHDLIHQFNEDSIQKVKRLIEFVYSSLEKNIETKLNNINESLWVNESNESKISSSAELTKILSYKQLIIDLINRINLFEQASCELFTKYKNNNIIKEFKPFISKINLSLDNRIIKTITMNQINEMINN